MTDYGAVVTFRRLNEGERRVTGEMIVVIIASRGREMIV